MARARQRRQHGGASKSAQNKKVARLAKYLKSGDGGSDEIMASAQRQSA